MILSQSLMIDRAGRKKLMGYGYLLMGITMIVLTVTLSFKVKTSQCFLLQPPLLCLVQAKLEGLLFSHRTCIPGSHMSTSASYLLSSVFMDSDLVSFLQFLHRPCCSMGLKDQFTQKKKILPPAHPLMPVEPQVKLVHIIHREVASTTPLKTLRISSSEKKIYTVYMP